MKDFVVYSILVGQYDQIQQPLVIDERFDYVLFSNDFNVNKIGVWQIRSIPTNVCNIGDNQRLSRYPKALPNILLPNYKASLYHDANIQVADQWVYDRFIELYYSGVDYAGVCHQEDDCIYDHSYYMSIIGVEHDYNSIKQCQLLYKMGFPRHFGLNENNIIFRRNCESMKNVGEEWWQWIKQYSHRDQYSFMYCLWKYGIPNNYFLPQTEWARTTKRFQFRYHDPTNVHYIEARKKRGKMGFLETTRQRCRTLSPWKFKLYRSVYHLFYRTKYPLFWQNIWGIFAGVVNSPWILYNVVKHKIIRCKS